jgi:acyl carrier protein
MQDKVREVINCSIDRLNELLPADEPVPKDDEVVLLGRGGRLDSMSFINLLVALEDELQKQLHVNVVLADEVMASGNALQTVGDLNQILTRVLASRIRTQP